MAFRLAVWKSDVDGDPFPSEAQSKAQAQSVKQYNDPSIRSALAGLAVRIFSAERAARQNNSKP